jgi:hypothetical protein
MPPRFLHRVWLGLGSRAEFDRDTQLLKDANPSYYVTIWDEAVLDDYPQLAEVATSLRFAYTRQLEDIVGLALVAQYGGAYFGRGGVPHNPLPVVQKPGPWMVHSSLIGSLEPRDEFWEQLLVELTGPYFNHLRDTELETIYLRHSSGQLSVGRLALYSLEQPSA